MRDRFREQSALEKEDDEPANAAQIDRRARADAELLTTLLQSEGYYDAEVETRQVSGSTTERFRFNVGNEVERTTFDDVRRALSRLRVVIHGGRTPTSLDAIEWAARCEALGAGEILLTSIDCDGARTGYDIALTASVASAVCVPVIASGGAGSAAHVATALDAGRADAALLAGVLHEGVVSIASIKTDLARSGIPVRLP